MKKFTSLLIGCCLALAGAVMAQPQPTEQQSPAGQPAAGQPAAEQQGGGGKKARRQAAQQQGANQGNPAAAPHHQNVQQTDAAQGQGQGAKHQRGGGKRQKQQAQDAAATTTGADQSAATTATAAPNARQQARQERQQARQERKNAKKGRGAKAETTTDANAAATGAGAAAGAGAATSTAVGPNNQQTGQANATGAGRGKRKLEQQKVQQIRQQHASFRAQPRPERVQAVTFNQNYRIQNSERWQGPRYEVFRSYRPQWHDHGWYHSHYPRIELIAGGYYYFNNGYWFPAWGYSNEHQYYAYDGPIYVGQRAVPPDQVIADVQAALQEMGYYKGEVDGLVGPLTREALATYQADEGLTPTAAIDEPTLEALGMAS